MNEKPNNQEAFPTMEHGFDNQGCPTVRTYSGMSLRDYFAAKAMQAFISEGAYNRAANDYPRKEDNDNRLCAASYQIADAMLKQREL